MSPIDLEANRLRLKELERDGEARRARMAKVMEDARIRAKVAEDE